MNLTRLIYPILLICFTGSASLSIAQNEVGQSVDLLKDGVKAKTDSLYFEAQKAKMKKDEPLALRLFEQFVVLRPQEADGLYQLAKLCYQDKKFDKAESYINTAIQISPKNKWYKEQYCLILAEQGKYQLAAEAAGQLAKDEPSDEGYLLMAAELFQKAKKYSEAIRYLDQAIMKKGPDEDILMVKQQIYLSMNDVEKAADISRQLIEQEPRNGKYYKLLGDLYDNNKFPGKAAEVYEKAEKIIPGDPFVQAGRAEHFLRTGDTASYVKYIDKAIVNKELDIENQVDLLEQFIHSLPSDSLVGVQGLPIVRQLLEQHPTDALVLWLYGDFLEINGKRDSAAMAYNQSLHIKNSVDVWRKYLNNFYDRGLGDSLVKNSERYIRIYPNLVEPQLFNAQGHYLKKEYDKAIKSINRAIDFQPENDKSALAGLYSTMAEIYHSNKQDDMSDKAYDKAISLDPDNAATLNNYAYYLSVRGKKLDEAEKMSKRSLDLKPGYATFLDTYGWILYKKGDFEKARTFVQKAIDSYGANADGTLYDHLGDIYFKLNNKEKAIENWKKAKAKGLSDALIEKKISEGKLYE